MPVIGFQIVGAGRQAAEQTFDRQRFEDDAGREGQHLALFDAEQLADAGTGLPGRLHAGFAGTGIGDAGVDDQRANLAAELQMAAAELDRRGAEAVLRKYAGDATAGIERKQRQIAAVRLADAGLGDAEADAGNGKQSFGSGRLIIDWHFLESPNAEAQRSNALCASLPMGKPVGSGN